VLQLVAEGHATTRISKELGISRRTVEVHRANILRKLQAHGPADLTRYAITKGLIECSARLTIR
jgi:DNA-binding NarL/FixJ family response regulator